MPPGFVFGETADTRPRAFRRCTHETEDFLQLVFVGRAREEGTAGVHFSHDAASGPDVDAGVVCA